ncbi:hypothetical protein BREV_BREV_00140 [Brevundimonas mediterranea]|uniref:Uncharacterized protein n=1 Tax=Brevundimonas mediterranea TaxID=74329 RepID=A0A7Z8Y368_9CAUL|nr:hypothetical protein BREV_BREV_00140 [Brevundimonas mediterranea]
MKGPVKRGGQTSRARRSRLLGHVRPWPIGDLGMLDAERTASDRTTAKAEPRLQGITQRPAAVGPADGQDGARPALRLGRRLRRRQGRRRPVRRRLRNTNRRPGFWSRDLRCPAGPPCGQAQAVDLAKHGAAADAAAEVLRNDVGCPALQPEGPEAIDTVFGPGGGDHGRLPDSASPIGSPRVALPFPPAADEKRPDTRAPGRRFSSSSQRDRPPDEWAGRGPSTAMAGWRAPSPRSSE